MILLAAHENDEGMHLAALEADGVVVKPITTRSIRALLHAHLGAGARQAAPQPDRERNSWLPLRDWDVLVVEDVEFNQEVIIELLASVGVQARLASNGVEALSEAAKKTPGTAPQKLAPAMAMPDEAQGTLPPIAGLDVQQGLSAMGGRQSVYIRMLMKFNDNLSREFEPQFRTAVQTEDWVVAERLVHSLKGVAQTLGARDLVRSIVGLETVVRQHLVAEALTNLHKVAACLKVISDEVSRLGTQQTPLAVANEPGQEVDEDSLQKLATLKDMLARRETDATELALDLAETMARTEYATVWKAVASAIDRYDFIAAEKEMLLLRNALALRWPLQQGT
jgi:HPt (histidine-containing phosphotransfer) domain-containing protein